MRKKYIKEILSKGDKDQDFIDLYEQSEKNPHFKKLSRKKQEEEFALRYLARLIVTIYLDEKCAENWHKNKSCSDCRKNLFIF